MQGQCREVKPEMQKSRGPADESENVRLTDTRQLNLILTRRRRPAAVPDLLDLESASR